MLKRFAWSTGSVFVALSVAESAYIAHVGDYKNDPNKRLPLQNAAMI
jgi:hypothetical protein